MRTVNPTPLLPLIIIWIITFGGFYYLAASGLDQVGTIL